MANKGGLLSAIKNDVEKTGSNRGKFFYVKSGAKARIRFLDDMDDGRLIHMHDRWDPQLKVPCHKNKDEDANCPYCGMDGVRNRDMYAWSIWDYDANEVKVFMFAANQCSPVPSLVALYETYGTISDRDFSISRSGMGTSTSYSLIPLDKSKFRNDKAKPIQDKAFWKALFDAYPAPAGEEVEEKEEEDEDEDDEEEAPRKSSKTKEKPKSKPKAKPEPEEDEDEDEEEEEDDGKKAPWDEEEDEEEEEYSGKTPKELYTLCREKEIKVKPKMDEQYYIKQLKKYDKDNSDDEFWGGK